MSFLYNMNMIVGLISGCLGLHAKGAARVVISVWMLESFLSSTGMVCEFVNTVYCKKMFECSCRFNKLPSESHGFSFSSKTNLRGTDFLQPHFLRLFIYLFIFCFLDELQHLPGKGSSKQILQGEKWTHTHTHSATLNYWGGGAFPKCSQSTVSSEHAVHSILIILAFGTLYICPLIPEKIMWSHVLQDSKNTNTYNSNSTNIK